MKKTLLALTTLSLVSFNVSSFADKIMITGSPVVLTQEGDTYTLPSDYKNTGDYYYVTVDGSNKVCYAEQQTTLSSLTPTVINVKVANNTVKWTCYNYDDQYFTVTQ